MVEACRQFGISRKTGYKILHRQQTLSPEGLCDLSRAPRTHSHQTSPDVEGSVLRVRKKYPAWGSKKIPAPLLRRELEDEWPARSAVDAILKRAGLVPPRKRRRMRHASATLPLTPSASTPPFAPATPRPPTHPSPQPRPAPPTPRSPCASAATRTASDATQPHPPRPCDPAPPRRTRRSGSPSSRASWRPSVVIGSNLGLCHIA